MCEAICGQGWRIDATDLHTGRVKAVLHPISMNWDEPHSMTSQGSVTVATRGPAPDDVWAHETGIYISRVTGPDTRFGHFGGFIEAYDAATNGATMLGLKSMDAYLSGREIADDNGGLNYSVTNRQQTLIGSDLVALASPKGVPLYALGNTSTIFRDRSWTAKDLKNIGEAVDELTKVIDGPRYQLQHHYNNGYWYSQMVFSDALGTDRKIQLKGDREGWQYSVKVSAQNQATRVFALGQGDDTNQLIAIAYDEAERLPIWHATPAWKDVTVQTTLNQLAAGYVAANRDPVATPGMVIAGMEPDPSVLLAGDKVYVDFGFGLCAFKGDAIVQNISWSVNLDEPVTRSLALDPIERPANSVRVQVPINSVAPTQDVGDTPQVPSDPDPTPGLVAKIQDPAITESSGMAYSQRTGGMFWTHDDEGENPQLRGIRVVDGSTMATVNVDETQSDPEWVRMGPDGRVYLGDTGDNNLNRTDCDVIAFPEPAAGNSTVDATRYPISYQGGVKRNGEGGLIHPVTGELLIITKSSVGQVYTFGNCASLSTVSNVGTLVAAGMPKMVSDATFTATGNFVLLRCAGIQDTLVFSPTDWKQVGAIPSPPVKKGESITVEPGNRSFLMGSEGSNSPYYRVIIPEQFRG